MSPLRARVRFFVTPRTLAAQRLTWILGGGTYERFISAKWQNADELITDRFKIYGLFSAKSGRERELSLGKPVQVMVLISTNEIQDSIAAWFAKFCL